MEKYSILIPAVPKDYNKIKYLLKSIEENLTGYEDIHFVVPNMEKFFPYWVDKSLSIVDITVHEDKEILDIDTSKCRYRPNWIYQQYLKMFQNVTKNDLFLTIDSDVIFNRPMPMFEKIGTEQQFQINLEKIEDVNLIKDEVVRGQFIKSRSVPTSDKRDIYNRILWAGWQQNHRPYFEFQEKMLNLPREYPSTFVSDTNFMSKGIIKEMLDRNNYTIESFISKSFDIIRGPAVTGCYPAECEIWGQYAIKYHPDKYVWRQAKTKAIGRVANTIDEIVWSDFEIENTIREMKGRDYDLFSLHSWYDQKV